MVTVTRWRKLAESPAYIPKLAVITDASSTMLQSKDSIIQRWAQYCHNLYKDQEDGDEMIKELESIIPSANEDAEDILHSEIEEAIRFLKRHKT